MTDAELKEVRTVRMKTLIKAWDNLKSNVSGANLFTFNHSIATKVVFHYVNDLCVLKSRYGIGSLVEPPKAAGLMAGAVLKYRPLAPVTGVSGYLVLKNNFNELLAIYHGLSVCTEYFDEDGSTAMKAILSDTYFSEWLRRLIFLIKERNYTSESLVMVFETLCWKVFPKHFVGKILG